MYSQGTGVIHSHTHFSSAPSVVHTVYRLPTESQRLRQLEGFYGVRIEWNEAVKCLGTFHHKGTGETFGRRGLLLCHLDSRNEKSIFLARLSSQHLWKAAEVRIWPSIGRWRLAR